MNIKLKSILIIILLFFLANSGCSHNKQQLEATLSVSDALSGSVIEGFSQALKPVKFTFPRDHGPHPRFRNEWWYYTGNLITDNGRHFGYQVTFFRTALSPYHIKRSSMWATKDIYMAHFAVTDVENEKFYAFDRFSRDGMELAGAIADPFRVWLEDWYVEGEKGKTFPLKINLSQDNISLELILKSDKSFILQGNKGLSQKSSKPGNASYYYSFTRMDTEGNIKIDEESFHVSGLTWMDREWSTSALDENQAGWDWFSLQLSDGREIMFYQMRLKDGTADPLSNGTIVEKDSSTRKLSIQDVSLKVLDYWKTPDGRVTYPSKWNLKIPSEKAELEITPHINNQELNVTVRYWEGAVKVKGTFNGENVSGNGYVELTGYSEMPGK